MEPIATYIGWVYPNETILPWSSMIVVYPYLTGLVAGAFTVSSLYQVFGMQRFKSVAHFALLTSLCFMLFVPLPLLMHLGHPERAFNAVLTPHWTSAMAMFGYFASFYLLLLIVETWFAFRPYFVEQAQKRHDFLGRVYRVLTLGSYDVSEHAMSYDRKWIFALAVIGIPSAHGLHGYVGFIFGSLKSREWWSSDLMPVVFLFSAIISGVSLLIVLYVVSCKLRKVPIELDCLKGMAYTLWGFAMLTLVLEGLEFANTIYKAREGIEMIIQYVTGPLLIPFFVIQFAIGAVIPHRRAELHVLAGHDWQSADRRRHGMRKPGADASLHDALERGHRRTGNREDRQGTADLRGATPRSRRTARRNLTRHRAAYRAPGCHPVASAMGTFNTADREHGSQLNASPQQLRARDARTEITENPPVPGHSVIADCLLNSLGNRLTARANSSALDLHQQRKLTRPWFRAYTFIDPRQNQAGDLISFIRAQFRVAHPVAGSAFDVATKVRLLWVAACN